MDKLVRAALVAVLVVAGLAGSLFLLVGAAVGAATGPAGAVFGQPVFWLVVATPAVLGIALAIAVSKAWGR